MTAVLDGISFLRPRALDEACALVADHVARDVPFHVVAGGTDLVVESHLAPPSPSKRPGRVIVDVSTIAELAAFEDRGDTIRLGGGTTYLALRREPLASRVPILAAMAKDVGAIQIQARGTLAGNVATASPAADGVCALAALDAVVGLRSASGERAVPLAEYFTGYKRTVRRPDELIAWIDVRVPSPSARWTWRKVGTRLAQAISKVAIASVIELEGRTIQRARFGMASVAPVTAPLNAVRAALEGRSLDAIDLAALDRAVDEDVAPIDDVRSTAAYRRHVARALVRDVVRGLDA